MAKDAYNYIWKDRKRTLFGLPLSFTVYYLTKTKLIRRRGFFNIEEDEIDLYKITDKKLQLPLGQRMFGCGTIHICSRDTDTPETDIQSVKKPREVLGLLDKYITEQRDRYGIRGRDMMGMMHGHMDGGVYDDHDDDGDDE